MFCPKCGAKNNDSAVFCANCGVKVEAAQNNSANPTAQNQTMSAFTPNGFNSPFGAQDPVTKAVKSFAGSTEVLVAAIAFTLAIILPIFNGGFDFSKLSILDSNVDIEDLIGFNIFGMISSTITVIASIPDIIIAVGIWITVASGLDRVKSLISTAGLTMIEIVIRIQAVLLIIGGGLYTIVMIFAMVENYQEEQMLKDSLFGYYRSSSYYSNRMFMLVLVLIIGLAIFAFLVWCKLQYATLVSNMKLTANMRKPMTVPVSCVVLTIISTVGVAISLIFTVSMNSLLGGFGFSIFGMLSQIVSNVMFVVIMTKYNDVMTRLKFQTSMLLDNGAPTNDFNCR